MTRRKNWDSGNIVEIALPSGGLTYAIIVEFPRLAFFDAKFDSRPSTDKIPEAPVAFQIWVMKYAVGKSHWSVVGHTEVPSQLLKTPSFFKQDAITGLFSFYQDGSESPATYAEVASLECAAIWDPEHVEARLEDHYAGIENIWVKLLAPKQKAAEQVSGGNDG